jgi:hypothetical protein
MRISQFCVSGATNEKELELLHGLGGILIVSTIEHCRRRPDTC